MLHINFHDDHTLPQMHAQTAGLVAYGLGVSGFGPCASMGVSDGGSLIAGVVFHNYHADYGVIELSAYSEDRRWLSPRVIRAMFGYPFDALKCQQIILRVSDRNHAMNSIANRFGFSTKHLPRMRGRDEGEYIHTLTDDAWQTHRLYRPFLA